MTHFASDTRLPVSYRFTKVFLEYSWTRLVIFPEYKNALPNNESGNNSCVFDELSHALKTTQLLFTTLSLDTHLPKVGTSWLPSIHLTVSTNPPAPTCGPSCHHTTDPLTFQWGPSNGEIRSYPNCASKGFAADEAAVSYDIWQTHSYVIYCYS